MSSSTEQVKVSEEPVLSDELILEFEQQIKDEEAQKVHLISPSIKASFIYLLSSSSLSFFILLL